MTNSNERDRRERNRTDTRTSNTGSRTVPVDSSPLWGAAVDSSPAPTTPPCDPSPSYSGGDCGGGF